MFHLFISILLGIATAQYERANAYYDIVVLANIATGDEGALHVESLSAWQRRCFWVMTHESLNSELSWRRRQNAVDWLLANYDQFYWRGE